MNQKGYRTSMLATVALLMGILLSVPAFAQATSETDVIDHTIKVYVDGVPLTLVDNYPQNIKPLVYEGNVYLPLWALREAVDEPVVWDSDTNSVYIGELPERAEITVGTTED